MAGVRIEPEPLDFKSSTVCKPTTYLFFILNRYSNASKKLGPYRNTRGPYNLSAFQLNYDTALFEEQS